MADKLAVAASEFEPVSRYKRVINIAADAVFPHNMEYIRFKPLILRQPERAFFSDFSQSRRKAAHVFLPPGEIVRLQSFTEKVTGERFNEISQGNQAALFLGIVTGPMMKMFFRPEEVHGTSGKREALHPLQKRHGYMTNDPLGFGFLKLSVFDLDPDRFAAIQTGRIYLNCLTRKKPADRQRFERSLAEPFLPVVNSDPVLVREIVKWRHGNEKVCFREEPARYTRVY